MVRITARKSAAALAAAVAIGLLATGCATGESDEPAAAEVPASGHRLGIATAGGGVTVLDAGSLEIVGELETAEPVRLSDAGDGSHLIARTDDGFQVLDTRTPELTEIVFPAERPGHVVVHGDALALFDDGTALTRVLPTSALSERPEGGKLPQSLRFEGAAAHHGVSVPLSDGTILTTVGTEDARTGVAQHEPHGDHWHELAASAECPGVHGEAVAADEAVVFGCEDGVLLFHDGAFQKLVAPAPGGATGSVYATEASPIAVADFATDPESESMMIGALSLIDTATAEQRIVELPAEARVTFRGIARGEDGLAYLLSADGSLRVLDPQTGEITEEFPVIDAWKEPADWLDAYPALIVHHGTAYVTDPGTKSVHAIDVQTGKRIATAELPAEPVEAALAAGHA